MQRVGRTLDASFLDRAQPRAHTVNRTLTFGELADLYCHHTPSSNQRDCRLHRWRDWFGRRLAWEVEAAFDELEKAGLAASTLNREIHDIKASFDRALREKRRVGPPNGWSSPAAPVQKRPEQMRRVQVSDADVNRLLRLARLCPNRKMYGYILVAVQSGARKGEIRRIRWDNADRERGLCEVGIDGKSGRYHTLNLVGGYLQGTLSLSAGGTGRARLWR